ncbi:hypothetical protein EYC84_010592 [Monilinia fructicola]|uniref:Uncharacterized protein n=1 Tax=Monilinia fructicola TaxID=38448 RepID=A0A5M9J6R6_MONFR|nr:hypothetical protein EYC84_010592 [Monilinia fructicola]
MPPANVPHSERGHSEFIQIKMNLQGKQNTNPPISPTLQLSNSPTLEDNNDHVDQGGGQKPPIDTISTRWYSILNDLGAMKDAWAGMG